MDPVTLSKQNRLYWLGRYAERVYTTLQILMKLYDRHIDGEMVDFAAFCGRLGTDCGYGSAEEFFRGVLFDGQVAGSVRSSVEAMLGNGMVLRETITSPTLAYLQMAHMALGMAETSEAPLVELQWVMDDVMAFRGSFDDAVEAESTRNITKAGGLVERISLMLRLDWQLPRLERELHKLLARLDRCGLAPDAEALETVRRAAAGEAVERSLLLASVEGLLRV